MTRTIPCPDSGTLLRYWTGRVAEPQAGLIRQHLAECRACAELLATAGESPVEESALMAANRPTPFRSASAAATLTPSGRLTFEFLERPHPGPGDPTPAPPGSGLRPGLGSRPGMGSGSRPTHTAMPNFTDHVGTHESHRSHEDVATLTPDTGPGLPAVLFLGACPACGDMLRDLGGTGWCLRCGYTSAVRPVNDLPDKPAISFWWLLPALGGSAGVVAATVLRDRILPDDSFMQVYWIGVEALAGILLYLVAHIWMVSATFRHWPEGELFKYVDPMTVLRYALEHTSRTRVALCLAAWGATAFVCAFVLFWMNDFAFKDKTKRRRPQPMPAATGRGFDNRTQEEEEAEEYEPPAATVQANDQKASDVPLIDLSRSQDPDRQPTPPRSTECVVIGYVPDPNDPNKIDQLILGTRGEDGTIRFAGTVKHFARVEEVEQGLAQIKSIRPLVNAPEYLPAGLNAIPLEPSLTCRVNFGERDPEGIYQNTVLQGVSRPAEETPTPPKN